jgi:hypothetical protein
MYITQDSGGYAINSKQLVTHLIILDYGDLEVRLYHKAIPGTQEDLIIESALISAFARGLELPKEQMNSFECYPIPEWDKEED